VINELEGTSVTAVTVTVIDFKGHESLIFDSSLSFPRRQRKGRRFRHH
jgi:hypothetical protein